MQSYMGFCEEPAVKSLADARLKHLRNKYIDMLGDLAEAMDECWLRFKDEDLAYLIENDKDIERVDNILLGVKDIIGGICDEL
jgi:hypothetical protein